MKKIGVLFGKERSFPMAFIEGVNGKNVRGVHGRNSFDRQSDAGRKQWV